MAAVETDHRELGLRSYFEVIRRRLPIILAVVLACVGASILLTSLQKNVYQATTKLVVGQGGGLPQVQFGNQVQTFTATMADLVHSNVVAQNVISNLRLGISPEKLLSNASTSIDPQSAVVKVSVRDHDPQQAVRIAQEIGLVFTQLVKERFASTATQGQTTSPPPSVSIFDPAHVLPYKVSPRPFRNVAVAIVLGLILGLVGAFLRDHFDRGVRTREDAERAFGVSVIGQVPFTKMRRGERRLAGESGATAEAFRGLRANLQYLGVKHPLQSILVTSATPEQGKTTVTANLAVAIARSGASVVAVEGDLRRPRLDQAFGVATGAPGLTNVLVGSTELDAALQRIRVGEDAPGLSTRADVVILASGPLPPNPSELLSSFQMRDVLDQLTRRFDYVLIDSPPLLAVADALELARMADGAILVVRRKRASTDDARELRSLIERLEVNVVGAVFTDVEAPDAYGYGADERKARAKAKPAKAEAEPEPVPASVPEPTPAAAAGSQPPPAPEPVPASQPEPTPAAAAESQPLARDDF